jgi:hypothetical protein
MKVIGFDCWTRGAAHYERLVESFARRGLDLMLIHLGSWGDEKGRPPEERIGKLTVRDISFYAGRSLGEILAAENPAAVIFTSTDAFAHRAFNRYCRARNVPTLHLFHGLQQLMEIPFKSSAWKRLWLMRGHVSKLAAHFIPVYARSLWETQATAAEWSRLAQDIAGRARGRRARLAAADSRADRVCVYIESEKECAVGRFDYSPASVFAVGNPDLVSFGLTAARIAACVAPTAARRDVVYIDTALVAYGFVYDSEDDFIRHVLDTHAQLERQGRRLIFKPHPAQAPRVIAAISASGVPICSKEQFLDTLQQSCACIAEPSSASLIPALIGLPLFLARYGKLAGQAFGALLCSYPRARELTDLQAFNDLLATENATLDPARTRQWIDSNTGPLPAQDMPARVADTLLELILERQGALRHAS